MALSPPEQKLVELFEEMLRDSKAASTEDEPVIRRPAFALDQKTGELTYDLSKAESDCTRCEGTGISGQKIVDIGNGRQAAPVICRCVSRNGGVADDLLARSLKKRKRRWSS